MGNVSLDDLRAPLTIAFEQRVAQTVKIQSKGTVLYATLNADLTTDYAVTEYTSALNITGVSDEIKAQIKKCFIGNPKKVILVQYKTVFEAAVDIIKKQRFNWICCDVAGDQADVATYAKENNKFTVVYRQAADNMNVVNFVNPSVVLTDKTEVAGVKYLPRLCGALAGLPYSMSMSAIIFTDLEKVELPEADYIDEGQFVLENAEDGVRVVAPVNSLTTLTTNVTKYMKSICFVEGMKRIDEDLKSVFKTDYKGHYKNHYKNQLLFLAAGQGYLDKLEILEILDPTYDNKILIDIESQRAALKEDGHEGVDDWTDEQVRTTTVGENMYILLDVKMLGAIEGMIMRVALF